MMGCGSLSVTLKRGRISVGVMNGQCITPAVRAIFLG